MAVMQRQESFNRFYQEFVVDEAPRCVEGGSQDAGICIYKDEKTEKGCAIGMQPEFQEIYNAKFEERGIESLYLEYKEIQAIIDPHDLKFFIELQLLHDNTLQLPHQTFIGKLKEFASDFGVEIPKKVEGEDDD